MARFDILGAPLPFVLSIKVFACKAEWDMMVGARGRRGVAAQARMRSMLKSKIHRATVTDANVEYEGSIALDKALMDAADILPYEMVHVLDVSNGVRIQTYAIAGRRGSGTVCVNGAAARLISPGNVVIVLAYADVPEEDARKVTPRVVYVDRRNMVQKRGLHKTFK